MPAPQLPYTFANASGNLSLSEFDANFTFLLNLILQNARGSMNYADVPGSPFQLNSGWQKVATISSTALGVLVGDTSPEPAAWDVFWTSVPANGTPPGPGELGMPVGQVEHFLGGLPTGDLYLRSASGAVATVRVGS